MKKVLVVGDGSYIGESFSRYGQGRLNVTIVGTLHDEWKSFSFDGFDSIVHVAGIAHRKQTPDIIDLYYKVNRDLAAAVAEKAKESKVSQFIFLSTMAVYGVKSGKISIDTIPMPSPNDCYGHSKYQAEQMITAMQSESFHVAIIRPPMVYGANCTGNYRTLRSITLRFGVCPDIDNDRSMIYIENLCMFISWLVDKQIGGTFCPADKEYFNTSQVMRWILLAHNKKIFTSKALALFIFCAAPFIPTIQKAFGNLTYADELSYYEEACKHYFPLKDAIYKTEKNWGSD